MTEIRELVRQFNEYAQGAQVQTEPSALGVPEKMMSSYANLLAHNGNDLYYALFGYDIVSIATNLAKLMFSLYSLAESYGIDVNELIPAAADAALKNVDLIRSGPVNPEDWNTIDAFVEKALWKEDTLGN